MILSHGCHRRSGRSLAWSATHTYDLKSQFAMARITGRDLWGPFAPRCRALREFAAPRHKPRRLNQPQMLAIQLDPLAAAELVDLEAIGELNSRAPAQQRILRNPADVSESDGLDRPAGRAVGNSELHLQMLAADNARVDDVKIPIEHRLWKALPPGTPAAQRAGGIQGELIGCERAVRVNHTGERFEVAARGNLGREGGFEGG